MIRDTRLTSWDEGYLFDGIVNPQACLRDLRVSLVTFTWALAEGGKE